MRKGKAKMAIVLSHEAQSSLAHTLSKMEVHRACPLGVAVEILKSSSSCLPPVVLHLSLLGLV
jgi:hypothetical protein